MKGKHHSDSHNQFSVTASLSSVNLGCEVDAEDRSAEWARFCLRHRALEETTEIACARVELPQTVGLTEVRIAVSFSAGKQMICTLFFVLPVEGDPLPVTSYHSGSIASLRGGYCLLLPIPNDMKWRYDVWPKSIGELNDFVANLTGSSEYLEEWVMERSRESSQLLMVLVTQSKVCYGYLLGSPKAAGFAEIRVIPIFFERVGELTRQPPVLVELALYVEHLETLLRHARQFQPTSDDAQANRRLREALHELANALENSATSCATKGTSST
ncbi:hypothetical protein [Pseudomonas aeruginosa]|uniref:hypothetical protein n=1 Tax=Pseudomonas aeruginosa TaxID=287 RepID=UPI000F84159E|nr:hypothetical protein [Pseudomonas aeruginosa]HBO4729588.1 hypothetical protein [Pseudomonas aeruginosa]